MFSVIRSKESSISISLSLPPRSWIRLFPMPLWRTESSRHILKTTKLETSSTRTNQLTLRHPRSEYFRNKNTLISLIILQNSTDRSCRGTHRGIQHVNVFCLKWGIEKIGRSGTMNWRIRWVSSLDRNEFSNVEIDSPGNWSMRPAHGICPNRETTLPNPTSSPRRCSIRLATESIEHRFPPSLSPGNVPETILTTR